MDSLNKTPLKIGIASDHAGFQLKELLKPFLEKQEIVVLDFGCNNEEAVDYPDYAATLSHSVTDGICDKGILVCGTGSGMSIVANKVSSIRAANCLTPEMAQLAIEHNNINILCLGARLMTQENALNTVDAFLNTQFAGGRHQNRVQKINQLTGL